MFLVNLRSRRAVAAVFVCLAFAATVRAGVSRAIQERYRRSFENKALFLKIPIFGEKQYVLISGRSFRAEPAQGASPARFKVGDRVRVVGLDFGGEEIRFKVAGISTPLPAEVVFGFGESLAENFPNSDVFDNALQATFTEGLKYTDLEDAQKTYIEEQFDRVVREMAATGGMTRESVLKGVAPLIPAHQEALRDVENLKSRNQDLSVQLAQSQTESRKLEADLKAQQAEVTRVKSQVAALQERIDSSTAQLARLGDDLRSARGATQGYQRELATLQKSLNIKVDPSRDLGLQIVELGGVLRKLQKDNENLESQAAGLRTNLGAAEARIAKLAGEAEDLKATTATLRETISTLTSKEDSLARQYLQLKQVKEKLENVTDAVAGLDTRVVEEKADGAVRQGRILVFLKSIQLGAIEYRFPVGISHNEESVAVAEFSSESIDYVRVGQEDRQLLRSLGDRLKLRLNLSSQLPTLEVKPDPGNAARQVSERERATWRWRIGNRGAQDGRVALDVELINRNSDPIPVLHQEHEVLSASVVRQVRNQLQPIPVAVGAVLGIVLFAVARLFRRPQRTGAYRGGPPRPDEPAPQTGTKQL